jgi:hypothetical protein
VKGILVIADALPGVHLISVTGQPDDYPEKVAKALGRFFAASADGAACWLCAHEDLDVDTLPREIKVWPHFVAFMGQFGCSE